MSEPTTTIQMDATTRAFYAGVAAGAKVAESLEAGTPGKYPYAQATAYYWLMVGNLAMAEGDGYDHFMGEKWNAYVQGAVCRAPQTPDLDDVQDVIEGAAELLWDVIERCVDCADTSLRYADAAENDALCEEHKSNLAQISDARDTLRALIHGR